MKWDDPPSRADRRRLFPTARAINEIRGSPILNTQEVDENEYYTNPLFFIEGQYSLGILKPVYWLLRYDPIVHKPVYTSVGTNLNLIRGYS